MSRGVRFCVFTAPDRCFVWFRFPLNRCNIVIILIHLKRNGATEKSVKVFSLEQNRLKHRKWLGSKIDPNRKSKSFSIKRGAITTENIGKKNALRTFEWRWSINYFTSYMMFGACARISSHTQHTTTHKNLPEWNNFNLAMHTHRNVCIWQAKKADQSQWEEAKKKRCAQAAQ